MGDDFDKDRYQLRSAEVREVAGLLFVCLAPDESTPDFDHFYEAIEPQLKPHGLEKSKVVIRHHYEVKANWKTLIENNRECYHCRVSHPEFCMSNYDLGLPGDLRSDAGYDSLLDNEYERWRELGLSPREVSFPGGYPYRVSRLPLKEGFVTESLDGMQVAPLMGDLTDPRVGSLRLITLPNFWGHANCDYAMTTRLAPVSAGTTRVVVSFLVHEDAVEGEDYDPERVAYVWKETSEQDWELCENNYAGIKSLAYEPGPFSELTESSVESFFAVVPGSATGGRTHRFGPGVSVLGVGLKSSFLFQVQDSPGHPYGSRVHHLSFDAYRTASGRVCLLVSPRHLLGPLYLLGGR